MMTEEKGGGEQGGGSGVGRGIGKKEKRMKCSYIF